VIAHLDFSGQDLSGEDLSGAIIEECRFRDCKLEGTDLRESVFFRCDFAAALGVVTLLRRCNAMISACLRALRPSRAVP
jgi:uncharacterized protein YjbI with pentapeptide repeats